MKARVRRLRSDGRWLICLDGRFDTLVVDDWADAVNIASLPRDSKSRRFRDEYAFLRDLGWRDEAIIPRLAEGLGMDIAVVRRRIAAARRFYEAQCAEARGVVA